MTRFGWKPVLEGGNIIALANDAQCSITLEPGGQFELSRRAAGNHAPDLRGECASICAQVPRCRDELGLGMLGLGFDPIWRRDEVPWMPKGRYRIMREYMPKMGRLGLDMMLRTCTVQANLDSARSRHGAQVPRQPGAAADRDGAVRQFAVHRGQAIGYLS